MVVVIGAPPFGRATPTDAVYASPRSVAAPMMRENTAWCSQRGVALVNITVALFAQPGTTLMRLACNARIPARTTGAGCIIKSFNAGVIHAVPLRSAAYAPFVVRPRVWRRETP